ncbi:hypothetical protein SAMN06297280_2829 [Arsukibacterium tuosuense]|uniref:Uncharacterized protein n=1 Tax=Arsukibacterium tuosuense TaxID=1323745 RepID=A0A285J4N9_9GAMM|nr:hypothetical protein SAMN06297280_2829 [Arsukibacterium tuosuense]
MNVQFANSNQLNAIKQSASDPAKPVFMPKKYQRNII